MPDNNLVEQDHRGVKQRIAVMLGFKVFRNAAITIAGIELMHRIRKGQFGLGRLGGPRRSCACSLERGARGLKSARRSREDFARAGYLHHSRWGQAWRRRHDQARAPFELPDSGFIAECHVSRLGSVGAGREATGGIACRRTD